MMTEIATKGTIPSGLKVYGSDRVSDNQCFIRYVIIIRSEMIKITYQSLKTFEDADISKQINRKEST